MTVITENKHDIGTHLSVDMNTQMLSRDLSLAMVLQGACNSNTKIDDSPCWFPGAHWTS